MGKGPSGSGFGAETPHVGAGRPRDVDGTSRGRDAGLEPLSVGLGSPMDWGEGLGPLGTGMGSPTGDWGPLKIKMWGWGFPGIGV